MGITTSVAADNNVSPSKLLNKPIGRTIVIPVDESRQSELAFDCKYGTLLFYYNVSNINLCFYLCMVGHREGVGNNASPRLTGALSFILLENAGSS